MKAKTYDAWLEIGYQVIKGERAEGKNNFGEPIFTRDQVEDIPGEEDYSAEEEEDFQQF